MYLPEEIAHSEHVVADAIETFGHKIAILWSAGKDSTTLLYIVRQACGGKIPLPVINLDTAMYVPELYEFRTHVAKVLSIDPIIIKRQHRLSDVLEVCETSCIFKEELIAELISNYRFRAFLTGLKKEDLLDGQTNHWLQRQLSSFVTINPISHFTETDVWEYIRKHKVPFCDSYRSGHIKLKCIPCMGRHSLRRLISRSSAGGHDEELSRRLKALGYLSSE